MTIKIIGKKPNAAKKQLGQGMTEYIIIVGVIAVAAIGVFGKFGKVVEQQVGGLSRELSGGDAKNDIGAAATTADEAVKAATKNNNLSNYYDNDG